MSTPTSARKKNGSTTSSLGAAPAAPGCTLGRGRGGGAAAWARSLGRGGRSSAPAATRPTIGGGSNGAPATMDGFPLHPSAFHASCGGGFPSSSTWFDVADSDASSPGAWDNDIRPVGGFMSYFGSQPQNFQLDTGGMHSSPVTPPPQVDNVRTERRIMWSTDEDVRVMSAWIEHSTDCTVGADRAGGQYWDEVVDTYNKTTPPLRRRNQKQCKDRWHKINKWTDLFECAYVKARRVFTSGYNDQMWIDAAHKFYLDDNKAIVPPLGPFVLTDVWKICREVPKWKTYNENLKNARKRKSFHLEGDSGDNEDTVDEMLQRPIGQKAAKKAALAAKNGKLKGSGNSDDGHSKDSPIELDKFDRYSKFQEENNEKRMKLLDRQEKLSSEKLEATKIAHSTEQEYKEGKKLERESKMMETYNNLISQDTSSMSADEKALRVSMMKCLKKTLFPDFD